MGAGPWATMFHAPMLAGASDLELSAVWARRPEAAQDLAERFGTHAAASFDELLKRCDAVAFAVPPDVQAVLAVRAAEAGRHLLLEKPLATNLADAERLATVVDDAGVRTQLVLTIRYRPEVRAFLDGWDTETVQYVRGSYLGTGGLPGSPFATPWRQQSPAAALLDVGPHTVDLLEAVAGPATEVMASGPARRDHRLDGPRARGDRPAGVVDHDRGRSGRRGPRRRDGHRVRGPAHGTRRRCRGLADDHG